MPGAAVFGFFRETSLADKCLRCSARSRMPIVFLNEYDLRIMSRDIPDFSALNH